MYSTEAGYSHCGQWVKGVLLLDVRSKEVGETKSELGTPLLALQALKTSAFLCQILVAFYYQGQESCLLNLSNFFETQNSQVTVLARMKQVRAILIEAQAAKQFEAKEVGQGQHQGSFVAEL